jgi:hypothetical protein
VQLLDYFKEKKREKYWTLKAEEVDRIFWRTGLGNIY